MRHLRNLFLVTIILSGFTTVSWSQKQKVREIPVTTSSVDATMLFKKGLALYDQGDNQKARELFQQAIEKDPKLAIAYLYLANTANSPGEFASALEKAKTNISGASDWEKSYLEYNQSFLNDDWNKRLGAVKNIVAKYPDAARAQVELGNVYEARKEYSMARQSYQRAIDLDPNWIGGYIALATSFIFDEPKEFAKAEQMAMKGVKIAPTSAGAQILLGDAYRAQQKLEEAKNAYSKALELDNQNTTAYIKRGHAFTFLGHFDEARQDYAEARKYDNSPAGAIMYTALSYLYENKHQQALESLMEDIKKMEGAAQTASSRYNLLNTAAAIALHYDDAGSLKEIIALMEPLAEQAGADAGTKEARLNLQADVLLWKAAQQAIEGDYPAAMATAEQAKDLLKPINNPRKLENYEFTMGYISHKSNDVAGAVKHFQQSDMTSVYNQYWLAKAYETAGQRDRAMDLYKKIANYNFNFVGYALIRNEIKQKVM